MSDLRIINRDKDKSTWHGLIAMPSDCKFVVKSRVKFSLMAREFNFRNKLRETNVMQTPGVYVDAWLTRVDGIIPN